MSDISYDRCPNDDSKGGTAQIGMNPDTGQPIELNVNGVASVLAIQSAMLTVSAAMAAGHEKDFLEKIALCLFGKLVGDPHALCPLFTICSMCLFMLSEQAGVSFDKEGNVVIAPPDLEMESGPACVFDEEEDDDGEDEGPMDGNAADGGGNVDGISP